MRKGCVGLGLRANQDLQVRSFSETQSPSDLLLSPVLCPLFLKIITFSRDAFSCSEVRGIMYRQNLADGYQDAVTFMICS